MSKSVVSSGFKFAVGQPVFYTNYPAEGYLTVTEITERDPKYGPHVYTCILQKNGKLGCYFEPTLRKLDKDELAKYEEINESKRVNAHAEKRAAEKVVAEVKSAPKARKVKAEKSAQTPVKTPKVSTKRVQAESDKNLKKAAEALKAQIVKNGPKSVKPTKKVASKRKSG